MMRSASRRAFSSAFSSRTESSACRRSDLAAGVLRGAQLTRRLGAVALHELAHLLELFDGCLHARALGADAAARVVDDLLRQAQPLRNGKGIGLAGNADEQVVRRAQGVHVKLTRGVHDAGLRGSVDLELRIVRRGRDKRAALAPALDDGDGQRRALGRVRAGAEFVEQQQRPVIARPCRTRTMFVMCAENVDSDCSMLCSSPMSAMISSNTGMVLPSAHGICRPHCVIAASRPMVLSVTVLPPVFGPVMTSVSNSPPSETSIGTAVSFGRSGWRARRS